MTVTLFTSGTVWTGTDDGATTALLVIDGVVAETGLGALARAAAIDEVRGPGAVERVDLEGGFLAPSFGDGHAHPIFGGLEAEGPAITGCSSVAEIVEAVRRFAAEHPQLPAIVGASYDASLAPDGLFDARWLDEAVPDRPVVLRANDYHTMWVNSRALELAGVDASTPEPELGSIPRRDDGSPLGTLREWGATDLVAGVIPDHPVEARVRALTRAGRYFLERGVTWVQDAWVEPADVDAYLEAVAADALPVRTNLAFYADPRRLHEQLPEFVAARARVVAARSPLLSARTVKFFADGVIEGGTGALLEPYCATLHDHGLSVWGAERLAEAVQAVDAAGFQVHIHAIGDRAVREALDAIEHAARVNGARDRRPVIAHAQLVDPVDLARFAPLGVIPVMQPLWAQLDASMTELTMPRLGPERSAQQYRLRTLLQSGARLAFGSDWPVSSGDPREGIAVAATRQTPEGDPAEGWMPDEILPVELALAAYSAGVAHQAFADGEGGWGGIRPGASADLVWFASDPRRVPARELPSVTIRQTYLAGIPRLPVTAAPADGDLRAPDDDASPAR
ncbi:amidohydrolase [Microcella alkalica]|uniref:amidohydrolase n=1 Tax=Microcella alkalica TaxID=355930 RepID=UPI00145E1242|nr:amidohydrolase [Microcella alkalica]